MQKACGYEDRRSLKEDFFHFVLFGTAHQTKGNTKIAKYFSSSYPTASEYILNWKRNDYRRLAWEMQRAESNFMFKRVLPRVMQKCPTARILTIHDSIICEAQHKLDVARIMEEEFVLLGLQASLRVEALRSERNANPTQAPFPEAPESNPFI